jgi:N-acetylneuraminate synthase
MTEQCRIIAEAGVNHNGSLQMALDLVDCAADAGADMVKFQTFRADALASRHAPKAGYQRRDGPEGETQLEMLRRLELSPEAHRALLARCAERGIAFLSTPFDTASLDFLVGGLGLGCLKIGSGDLTNGPLLLAAASSGADIVLSTGMASLGEVEEALGVLGLGMAGDGAAPSRAAFAEALHAPATWEALRRRVTLLHCTTEYPAAVADTNLRAMATLASAFCLPVGYSDHTQGNAVAIAAAALGARVIEKHFTLDRRLPGPDHAASLEPAELAALVRDVRAVGLAMGSGIKQPGRAELANRVVARKSLVAARDLPAGHRLAAADIAVLRPGNGLSAMAFWDVQGQPLAAPAAAGEPLQVAGTHRAGGDG